MRLTLFLLTLGLLLVTHVYSPLGATETHRDNVRSCADEEPFALQRYQWRNRVLVVSAPNADDRELLEQLAELAPTSDEFADRDMVLVTLLDNAGQWLQTDPCRGCRGTQEFGNWSRRICAEADRQRRLSQTDCQRHYVDERDLCSYRHHANAAKRTIRRVERYQLL